MKKLTRVLGMLIAMAAIALLAIGIDKGSRYFEKKNYEKERIEKYGQNYADVADWRAKISEVSQSQEDIESFIQKNALWEEEISDADSNPVDAGNEMGEEDVSEDVVSGNDVSENSVSSNGISSNDISGDDISENSVLESSVSGNGLSGNSVSDNCIWEDQVLWEMVSGNGLVDITLKDRQKISGSYQDTIQMNETDQKTIAESSIDFSDKKICCLGDSITEAANLVDMENYQQYSYPTKLGELLGAKEVVNLGIGGSSIGRYWENAFVERYKDIPKDTDIIIVMGGTNDGFCLQEDMVGSFAERAPRTLVGDLDELMRGLKQDYPDAQIIFVTPLPNVLHDILRKDRPNLLPQRIIVNAILELSREYGFDTINLYDSNLLDSHDAAVIYNFQPDGVHCNPAGYQILAEHIGAEIIRMMQTEGESTDV